MLADSLRQSAYFSICAEQIYITTIRPISVGKIGAAALVQTLAQAVCIEV